MGGKSTTSTQTVQIPPEVMARYNSVNARAEKVAETPFQAYNGQFVAPINQTQQAGINQTGQAAGLAQPYYGAATGMTLQGSQAVGPLTQGQIGYYQNPYTEAVVQPTLQALQQQQGIERSQLMGNQAKSGAFGSDRAGLERAALARQQGLGMAQAIAPLYQQGYNTAVQTAQGQQGVVAQDLTRRMQGAQQIAGIGTGAQQAALQGAQAQIGAGTLQQQTQQADLTANYQQFLQERGYPFQVAQFLANIAMGTGALSGSTTTTTQPSSFFSDERLKENIQPIGETFDGQPIYKYNYKGEPGTQIGLIAQDVEKRHPDAVGLAAGFKTVDYDKATDEAAARGAGLVPREHRAVGGQTMLDPLDMKSILEANKQSLAPFAQAGLYGGGQGENPMGGKSYVPKASLATPKLITAGPAPRPQDSGLKEMMNGVQSAQNFANAFTDEKGLFGEKGALRTAGRKIFGDNKPAEGAQNNNGVAGGAAAKTDKSGVAAGPPAAANNNSGAGSTGANPTGGVAPTQKVADLDPSLMDSGSSLEFAAARGGFIRQGYAGLGRVVNPMELQDPSAGVGAYIDDATQSQEEAKMPGQQGGGGGGSKSGGLGSDLMMAGNLAMMGAKAAPMVAEGFSALMAALPFSDARLKDNIRPVGKTYDGQNIYAYDFGDGRTQMGLMAQEVARHKPEAVGQRDGFMTLDYDRATEDAAPRYRGGLAPARQHFAVGGFDNSLSRTLGFEGGYAEDTGGPTMMGISSRANPDVDLERVRTDPEYRANIYRERYWNPIGADDLDPKLQHVAFDTSVNLGAGRTKQLLEQAGGDPQKLLQLRQQHYERLIENDPETYGKYSKGWSNRVAGLAKDIGVDAPSGGVAPRSFANRFLPTQNNSKGEEEVNWKQLLIPTLTGLGAMASSPSRYFGAAALQGLGAGAQAYANLEKQQQEIAESKSRTEQNYAAIPNDSIITDREGRTIGVKVYVGGELKAVPIADFYRAQSAGTPYALSPRPGTRQDQPAGAGTGTGTGSSSGTTSTDNAPAAPAAPNAPNMPTLAPYRELPQPDQDIVLNNARQVQQTGTSRLATSPTANPFDSQGLIANTVQGQTQQRLLYAKALGEIPRDANSVNSGKFSAEVATPVVNMLKSTFGTFGIDLPIASAKDLGNAQVAQKIATQLATLRTTEAGQRAAASLERILATVPTQANTPEGAAALLADLFQVQQREIDLNRYLNRARDLAEKKAGINRNESRYIGDGLVDQFAKNMEGQYNKEKKILSDLYMTPFSYKGADGKTVKTYLMPYLAGNAGSLPPNLQKAVSEKYGPEILRYFTAQ